MTCKINGFEPGRDVRCNVTVDGQGLGAIEAGQKQTYNLTPGPHTVNVAVVGGQADLWAPTAPGVAPDDHGRPVEPPHPHVQSQRHPQHHFE